MKVLMKEYMRVSVKSSVQVSVKIPIKLVEENKKGHTIKKGKTKL